MKTTEQKIEEIKANGYDLDFGAVFNDAFETYKKSALMTGLATLVFGIVLTALGIGVMVAMGGVMAYADFMTGMQTNGMSATATIVYCLSMCIIAGITNPFSAGIIKMANQADRDEDLSVGDAFQCYKPPYFAPLFVEALLVSAFSVGVTTLLQRAFPMDSWVSFVSMLISALISFGTMMAVPLIIFGNQKPVEAIRGSFIIVFKKPFLLLALVIVAYLLACVGILAFCIGVLFTIPFITSMYYTIYKHSVGVDDKSEIDEIGSSEYL
jgi:hypothetical protein